MKEKQVDLPDAIQVDGITVHFLEKKKMAKKPDKKPDKSDPVKFDKDKSVVLIKYHFDSMIRQIKQNSVDRVAVLRTATYEALKGLGAKRDLTKAVTGPAPKGSDQGDIQTFIVWTKKIVVGDVEAVVQLIAIDATATVRMKG